jgi:1-acyl-sn-glycerol-3-phosphate acyltransferase
MFSFLLFLLKKDVRSSANLPKVLGIARSLVVPNHTADFDTNASESF